MSPDLCHWQIFTYDHTGRDVIVTITAQSASAAITRFRREYGSMAIDYVQEMP